jgi:hypothetical protein
MREPLENALPRCGGELARAFGVLVRKLGAARPEKEEQLRAMRARQKRRIAQSLRDRDRLGHLPLGVRGAAKLLKTHALGEASARRRALHSRRRRRIQGGFIPLEGLVVSPAPEGGEAEAPLDVRETDEIICAHGVLAGAFPQRDGRIVFAEPLSRTGEPFDDRGFRGGIGAPASRELERGGEVARRLAIGVFRERVSPGQREVAGRLRRDVARIRTGKMVGELIGVLVGGAVIVTLERIGDGRVKEPGAREAHLLIDHVAKDRMGEVVHDAIVLSSLLENVLRAQLVDRLHQSRARHRDYRVERIVRRPRANDRGHRRDALCIGCQAIEACHDRFANSPRKIQVGDFPAVPGSVALVETPRAHERLERLLDKERISTRPPVEQRGELARHGIGHAEDSVHELVSGRARQRAQMMLARCSQPHERLP